MNSISKLRMLLWLMAIFIMFSAACGKPKHKRRKPRNSVTTKADKTGEIDDKKGSGTTEEDTKTNKGNKTKTNPDGSTADPKNTEITAENSTSTPNQNDTVITPAAQNIPKKSDAVKTDDTITSDKAALEAEKLANDALADETESTEEDGTMGESDTEALAKGNLMKSFVLQIIDLSIDEAKSQVICEEDIADNKSDFEAAYATSMRFEDIRSITKTLLELRPLTKADIEEYIVEFGVLLATLYQEEALDDISVNFPAVIQEEVEQKLSAIEASTLSTKGSLQDLPSGVKCKSFTALWEETTGQVSTSDDRQNNNLSTQSEKILPERGARLSQSGTLTATINGKQVDFSNEAIRNAIEQNKSAEEISLLVETELDRLMEEAKANPSGGNTDSSNTLAADQKISALDEDCSSSTGQPPCPSEPPVSKPDWLTPEREARVQRALEIANKRADEGEAKKVE